MLQKARQLAFLLLLVVLIWTTGRAGFASLLYTFASRANQPAAAIAAVNFSPRDAQAHFTRGALLEARRDLRGAAPEYTQAVSLRPRDNFLWLALARIRELNGDREGALAAASEAVSRAPFYAQPHWQKGNLLIRAGRPDDGFGELRLAAASDSSLLPAVIDLAARFSGGKTEYVLQMIQPRSPEVYAVLAAYFKKQGNSEAATAMLEAAGAPAEAERRAYIADLIAAKDFRNAYRLWSKHHPADPDRPMMSDGGFEEGSDLEEPGFGWRAQNKAQGIALSLDGLNPKAGKWSLAATFNGDSDASQPVISQWVMIEPRTHYQLHFAARTEELVSGGLPYLSVTDASTQQQLGQTGAFPKSSRWLDYTIDFTAPDSATVAQITLRRQPCSATPCPAFGRLWLDEFSVGKK